MNANKACPILLRQNVQGKSSQTEILLFEHPLAGVQLVKGSIEAGELPQETAIRELYEEAGISGARVIKDMGIWDSGYAGQVWSLQLCHTPQVLPESWSHCCADDGGHIFRFFWHPLHATPPEACHPLFQSALRHIQTML